jgi:hypothetical protein
VLGVILIKFLPFCVFAQGFYFDVGPTIGRADNYPLTMIDFSLKAGYGPFGNIPVYVVAETGCFHGLVGGTGIIYYPIRFIQFGTSLGLAFIPSEHRLMDMGFGWNVSAAIDLGRRNHGFLTGFRYLGAVNEFEISNMYCVFAKYAYRKKIPQQSVADTNVTENESDPPSPEFFSNAIYGGISTSAIGLYEFLFFSSLLVFGLTLEYERSLNKMFSISIDTGIDPFIRPYAEIKGRLYPWSKTFFIGLGAGILIYWEPYNDNSSFSLLSISPTIGWRINIGKQNRWVIMPSTTHRFLFDSYLPWRGIAYNLFDAKINLNVGYKF